MPDHVYISLHLKIGLKQKKKPGGFPFIPHPGPDIKILASNNWVLATSGLTQFFSTGPATKMHHKGSSDCVGEKEAISLDGGELFQALTI